VPRPESSRRHAAGMRIALASAALAVVVLVIVAVEPEPARAIPCPFNTDMGPCDRDGEGVSDWLDPTDNWFGGDGVVDWIVNGLINLFSEPLEHFTTNLFHWLVHVPDAVAAPPPGQGSGTLHSLGAFTAAMALGLIGAMVTLAAIHFWASGVSLTSGGDGSAPFEAVYRSVGAALFIAAWPFVYENAIALANVTSDAVLNQAQLDQAYRDLMPALLASSLVSAILVLVALIATLLVSIAVILMKIGITVGVAVLYIAMPLAVALWVLPSQSWIAHLCLRLFAGVVVVPVVWALTLAVVVAIPADEFNVTDDFVGSILPFLIGLFGWFMLIKIAQMVLRAAGAGAGNTGFHLLHGAMIVGLHGMRAARSGGGAASPTAEAPKGPDGPKELPRPTPQPPGPRPAPAATHRVVIDGYVGRDGVWRANVPGGGTDAPDAGRGHERPAPGDGGRERPAPAGGPNGRQKPQADSPHEPRTEPRR
jgi:hypothetical protein